MGQLTTAIMYGVHMHPKDTTLILDDEHDNGMLDRWERDSRIRVKSGQSSFDARKKVVPHWFPDQPYEGEFVGFVVASAISEDDWIPELGPVALNDFAKDARYQKSYEARKKAWERFATWAKKNGYKLPRPKLYLTSVEVA